MIKISEGKLDSKGQKIAIVVSRFNDFIGNILHKWVDN
jgi:6,7-dimethyl-8-ribityllumazine synthase